MNKDFNIKDYINLPKLTRGGNIKEYIIQKGDTLSTISKNLNIPIDALAVAVNNRKYYLPEQINLSKVNLGIRNRGDLNKITNTQGGVVTAFTPFEDYEKVNPNNPNNSYIGINNGQIKLGRYSDFTPGDKLSRSFKNTIKEFVKNPDGTPKLVRWNDNTIVGGKRVGNKDNPNNYVPLVKVLDDSGKEVFGTLNLLSKSSTSPNTFGSITGGRVIMDTEKGPLLVSGSIQDIMNSFEQQGKPIDFYTLDNGSYSLGLRTKDKTLTEEDLKAYDRQNSSGGNFLYLKNFNEQKFSTPNIRTGKSESYKKGHSLENERKGIVLHHTGFTDPDLKGVTKYIQDPTKEASSHVLIGYDGKRRVFANPNQVTFHSGKSSWKNRDNVNDYMLGVEFQGNTNKTPLTNAQIKSFIEYIDPVIRKNKIDLNNIITHEMVAPTRKKDVSQDQYKRIMEIVKNYYK